VLQRHASSAETARCRIQQGLHDPPAFRAALLNVPPADRDQWLDAVLGLDELPDDGPELPRGCVPYLPCPVDALLRMVDQAPIRASDVFVDVGSGLGRATTLVHLLTGAGAIGLEVQPALALASRGLASRLRLSRVSCVEGDATTLAGFITIGSVFFFFCPFGGDRLAKVLADLEPIARTRTLRVCSVLMSLPACSWLTLEGRHPGDLAIHRSTLPIRRLAAVPFAGRGVTCQER
jgi:SAM-dependent methyltransferase